MAASVGACVEFDRSKEGESLELDTQPVLWSEGCGDGHISPTSGVYCFERGKVSARGLLKLTADFDGDGDLDLAVANEEDASLTVLYGRGAQATASQAFVDSVVVALPGSFHRDPYFDPALFAFDQDGDGALDIGLSFSSSKELWLLTNAGDRNYELDVREVLEVGTMAPLPLDYDSDGDEDLLVGAGLGSPAPSLRVLKSEEGAQTYASTSVPMEWSMLTALIALPEPSSKKGMAAHVLAAGTWAGVKDETPVWVHRIDGQGIDAEASSVPFFAGADPQWAFSRDLGEDGLEDVIIGNRGSGDLSVALGMSSFDGAPAYAAPARVPVVERGLCEEEGCVGLQGLAVGDFDGDGRIEGAASLSRAQGGSRLYAFPIEGQGMVALANDAHGLATGDFNADGVDDIVYSHPTGTHLLLSQP